MRRLVREIAKGHDADGEEAPLDNNGVFVALRQVGRFCQHDSLSSGEADEYAWQCGENSAKVIFDATSTHLLSTLYILGTAYQHLSKVLPLLFAPQTLEFRVIYFPAVFVR